MADHLHKQIRAALVAKLTGLTTSAARVYANRLHPLAEANLPGLRIYLDSEAAEHLTADAPAVQERRPAVVVECCARHGSTLDDVLDLMSKEVEIALAAGITVATRTLELDYTGMDLQDEQLDKPVGVKRMTFALQYHTLATAPDVLI